MGGVGGRTEVHGGRGCTEGLAVQIEGYLGLSDMQLCEKEVFTSSATPEVLYILIAV